MEIRAKARGNYIRITARKMRLIADLIRGKRVEEALQILKFTQKKASEIIEKVLISCVANASNVKGVNVDNLYIVKIVVDSGATMKRFMTRAMGRASSIKKRTSHITIYIGEK